MKEIGREISSREAKDSPGETTKDKAGSLPPSVYSKEQNCNRVGLMEGLGKDLNTEEPIVFTIDEEEKEEDLFVHATSEGGDAPQVTFVDDCLVAVAVAEARPPPDEYKTDSGDDFPDREDKDIAPVTVSRSGRPIFQDFYPRDMESCRLAAARCVKLWSLNANLFFEEPHQLTKFA